MAKHTLTIPEALEAGLTWAREKANAEAEQRRPAPTEAEPTPALPEGAVIYANNDAYLAARVGDVLRSYVNQRDEEEFVASTKAARDTKVEAAKAEKVLPA